jgi:hypothetical protein
VLNEFFDATVVLVIAGKRLSPRSVRKSGPEVGRAGAADAGAGCAKLDWNVTGCCKTLRYGRLTVISEPVLFHDCGQCVDKVVESG